MYEQKPGCLMVSHPVLWQQDNQRELCFWQEWNQASGPNNWLVSEVAEGG